MLTQAILKEHLHYDPETGLFRWIKPTSFRVRVGQIAGADSDKSRRQIRIFGTIYKLHRLAWLYVYGEFPPLGLLIDHINSDASDNRISNLRIVTPSQNLQNTKLWNTNKTGYRGVSFHKQTNKYRARIKLNQKEIALGLFSSPEEAYVARCVAERSLFTHTKLHMETA